MFFIMNSGKSYSCKSSVVFLNFCRFGFGLMNAIDMVELAEKWTNVDERVKCEIPVNVGLPR